MSRTVNERDDVKALFREEGFASYKDARFRPMSTAEDPDARGESEKRWGELCALASARVAHRGHDSETMSLN